MLITQVKLAVLLGLGVLLQSCAVPDHKAYFQQYEQAFKQKVAYTDHAVLQQGLKIHVREYGKRTDRPTWVLMHGFPDSLHLYDRFVPLLAQQQHVLAFDFIGWGSSDKPTNHQYDVASLRQNLESVIAHFDLQSIIPVVHDASGQVGIDWALDNPKKTAGLVLLNTYYAPSPTLKAPEAIARFSSAGFYRDLSVFLTQHVDALWMNGYNAQLAKFINDATLRQQFQKILGYQSLQIRPAFYGLNRVLNQELAKREKRIAELQQFSPPVKIIFGNDDPYLNAGVAKTLHQLLPNSTLDLIENAGHFVQIDQPEAVMTLLQDFPIKNDQ